MATNGHRTPREIAESLSYSTQSAVALIRATGIPAWATSWSDLHDLVSDDGTLSELGRLVGDECMKLVQDRPGPRA